MSVRFDLHEGKENGVPLCCRWRFALEWALRPQFAYAVAHGISFTSTGMPCVPCGLFHSAALTHAEWEDILNAREGRLAL